MPYKDRAKQLEYLGKWRREHPRYWVERYHRLQDEMGYHGDPNLVYPLHLLMQAFQQPDIEIVEIARDGGISSSRQCRVN